VFPTPSKGEDMTRGINITFNIHPDFAEKVRKRIGFNWMRRGVTEGDYLVVVPKIFCGNFFLQEVVMDGSEFSIISTDLVLIDFPAFDEKGELIRIMTHIIDQIEKRKPDFFFIVTSRPSTKTFKIKYKWIEGFTFHDI